MSPTRGAGLTAPLGRGCPGQDMEKQRTCQILLQLCHSHLTPHCKIPLQLLNETLLSSEKIIKLFSTGSLKDAVCRWGASPCDSQLAPSSLPSLVCLQLLEEFSALLQQHLLLLLLFLSKHSNIQFCPQTKMEQIIPLSLNMPTAQCQIGRCWT